MRSAQLVFSRASPLLDSPSFLVGSKPSSGPRAAALYSRRVLSACALSSKSSCSIRSFQRIGGDRLTGLVARLEQVDHLANRRSARPLAPGSARIGAAEFGVGEEGAVLALVDEAAAFAVEHHGIDVAQAIAAIGQFARREVAPIGADRRGMAAAPLAPGHGADVHRHAQAIALVVAACHAPSPHRPSGRYAGCASARWLRSRRNRARPISHAASTCRRRHAP